jgi:MiaB/RimO family radical SAM methylthiotransferase
MIANLKEEYELTQNPEDAELLIVNSCGFITPAKEETLQTIFDLDEVRKEGSTLVMSGCMSERYKNELPEELPEVDIFTGVGDYHKISEIVKERENRFSNKAYLIDSEERVVTGSISHAYIKIGEGCNQSCSFCSIPKFKGKLQSRNLQSIVSEIENLVAQGFYDFSFISQDSSSYGRDIGEKDGLLKLIDEVEKIEGLKSARILYLYPTTVSEKLISKIANSEKFHNYFDIPIQHISDRMLKIMKRGFGKEQTLKLLQKNAFNSKLICKNLLYCWTH